MKKMKIVAAVDLSEYSATIVRYGAWLCTRMDAELLLVNVINQRDLDMVRRAMVGYEAFSFPNYLTEQIRDRERQIEDLIAGAGAPTVAHRVIVRDGIPYRELLAVIDAEQAQLAVVGTKGRSNLADAVVGSTARKLYRRSPIPLLTIPAGFNEVPA